MALKISKEEVAKGLIENIDFGIGIMESYYHKFNLDIRLAEKRESGKAVYMEFECTDPSLISTDDLKPMIVYMKEHELEQIMYDFINGEIDVLVSTTIIETGLDISNVTTMIIHDSDNMGLSQLYQLRGRVGRSNRTAYAFLMYKRDKMLKEVAEKRLAAIKEFTDLGSGFKIAMRDLEIRGAGNLLGMKQHGHMEAVGYDMYCKMLNEAVQNLNGIAVKTDFTTTVDLDVDAYIPPEYIMNEVQKLDIYKRIAGIENGKERDDMKDELLDRFGDIPRSVDNLLRIALIRVAAHSLDMMEIKGKNERILFTFRPDADIDPSGIPDLLKKYGQSLSFTAYGNPFFTYKYKKTGLVETDGELLLEKTEELLEEMRGLLDKGGSDVSKVREDR